MQGGAAGPPPPDVDRAQFEADKRAVYKHPLFPLLALLLERCEQATAGAESPDAFSADLQAFVQHQRRDRRPFLVDDPELDGLMIKSIQVLRIHLLELEKVQELCRDFCGRYIACLKTKMQSENLLRTDYTNAGGLESNNNMSTSVEDHSSTSNSPQYQQQSTGFPYFGAPDTAPAPITFPPPPQHATFDVAPLVVHGSTPISQIGASLACSDSNSYPAASPPQSCPSPRSGSPVAAVDSVVPPLTHHQERCGDERSSSGGAVSEGECGGKRGGLPRRATQAMRSWLFQHLVHPYPTEEEKRSLASETHLTLLQVNNWFINARRRILQPMLDSEKGGKKCKNGSALTKRYWPEVITNSSFNGLLSSSEDEDEEIDDRSQSEADDQNSSDDRHTHDSSNGAAPVSYVTH